MSNENKDGLFYLHHFKTQHPDPDKTGFQGGKGKLVVVRIRHTVSVKDGDIERAMYAVHDYNEVTLKTWRKWEADDDTDLIVVTAAESAKVLDQLFEDHGEDAIL